MNDTFAAPAHSGTKRRESVLLFFAAILTSVAFIWHLFAVVIVNLPPNPVSLQVGNVVDAYVSPFFVQGWGFFAPEPIDLNIDALFRFQYADAAGRERTSSWFDMTSSLNRSVNYNRVSPLVSVRTAVSAPLNRFLNDDFLRPRKKIPGAWDALRDARNQPYHLIALERTAMALAESKVPVGRSYSVQLSLRQWWFPRYTHRAQPDDSARAPGLSVTFPWTPGDRVASFLDSSGR